MPSNKQKNEPENPRTAKPKRFGFPAEIFHTKGRERCQSSLQAGGFLNFGRLRALPCGRGLLRQGKEAIVEISPEIYKINSIKSKLVALWI
jgi:hypothetical protein